MHRPPEAIQSERHGQMDPTVITVRSHKLWRTAAKVASQRAVTCGAILTRIMKRAFVNVGG